MIRIATLSRILHEINFPINQWQSFRRWAFEGGKTIESWNRLHGNLFTIKGSDNMIETLTKMTNEYKKI